MSAEQDVRTPPGDASEWIAAIAANRDRTRFALLFNHFAPRVKAYLLKGGTTEQMAEELAQETLLAVWRKADQFDPLRATAAAWIFTIARNLRVDCLRHDRRPADGRIAEPTAEPPTPEQELKTAQGTKRIRTAIAGLPKEQAEVLRLSFFEELTHPEIATGLGVPLGTVKSRIRLATAQLRLTLEGHV